MNCCHAKKSFIHDECCSYLLWKFNLNTSFVFTEVVGKKGYTITRPYNGSPEQEKDILYSEFSRGLWSGLILAIFYKFLKLSLIPKLQKGEGNAYAYIKAMILIWVSLVCDLMSVLSKIIRLYVFEQRLLIVCYRIWLQLPFSVLRNDEKLV